ncbi:MAG: SGNH/GDSL hydrolase family protein, partial [Chloroflexi bacterium]|nr:SGNH/GDSL hydrolase family protein [Chloroflexota bacterium]
MLRIAVRAIFFVVLAGCESPAIEFEKGEHVIIIGNALADRMQHDGWLEAYLQAELPDHELVIRNHGFTGDRIDDRPRSNGFPTAGDYLSLSGADVIFAMFGYNESFDDDPDRFGEALTAWVDSSLARNYSGNGPPGLVLFSPIAHEDLNDPDFPDGKENNMRLAAYSEAIRAVAEEKNLAFVDLFTESGRLYKKANEPLTINGVHLSAEGNKLIAEVITKKLLGHSPRVNMATMERVRSAVLDKNWYWFNRYRATDGNDVWGSRSVL